MIHSAASLPRRPRSTQSSRNPGNASHIDSILRQQRSLEQDLHFLLNAQADALLAGLGGPTNPASSSANTSAMSSPSIPAKDAPLPTASALLTAPGTGKAIPLRQPPPAAPLSLRATRRGIWDAMRSLSSLKEAEATALEGSLANTTSTLTQLETWTAKRAGLRASIASTLQEDTNGDSARTHTLRDEQAALDMQISSLEAQLAELRSQRRAVGLELQEVENRVQARLSSFRGALGEVERDIERFVHAQRPAARRRSRHTPGAGGATNGDGSIRLDDGDAQQRMLDEIQEEQIAERDELEASLRAADFERQALDDGATVWNDAVGEITGFERTLAREIRALARKGGPPNGRVGLVEHTEEAAAAAEASSVDLVKIMDDAIALVESKLKLAESKGWNLLVAAIGAELDAFQQGREILFGAAVGSTRSASPAVERGHTDVSGGRGGSEIETSIEEDTGRDDNDSKAGNAADSKLVSPTRRPRPPHQDDPDPDLLISG